jgi:hypothetical protein
MKQVHLDRFGREVTCTYRGETYRVRYDGAVFRRRRDRARLRPLDEKWTYGMHLAGHSGLHSLPPTGDAGRWAVVCLEGVGKC